jgi:predicted small metal-binding protein
MRIISAGSLYLFRKGAMMKAVHCDKVDPSSDCKAVIRGNTVEEVLGKVKTHAREHGIREVTPALLQKVKASIEDE